VRECQLGVVIFELDLNTIVRLDIDLSFVLLVALCAYKSRKGTAILKYGLNGKWIYSCFYFKLRLGDYKKNKFNINTSSIDYFLFSFYKQKLTKLNFF